MTYCLWKLKCGTRALAVLLAGLAVWPCGAERATAEDLLRRLQEEAHGALHARWGHWGPLPGLYHGWASHSNRLIPLYTFGMSLESVRGEHSVYRDAKRLTDLYGRLPEATLNPQAEYFDQTDVCRLQQAAVEAGKKYIILVVFDGMDWQTTWAAATYRSGRVAYQTGRGTGLSIQDYDRVTSDYGFFVTSPHNGGTDVDVDAQLVKNAGGRASGGYNVERGGPDPWTAGSDVLYLLGKARELPHVVTDSAASATSLVAGIKTYNDAINVDSQGRPVVPLTHTLQHQGWSIGVVTSVPISHATPACAYSQNVSRDDYQDLTRDMLGLVSISNRNKPLPGVDVLLGAGWGETAEADSAQGQNYLAGNRYLTAADRAHSDITQGGRYRVVERQAGQNGAEALAAAAQQAAAGKERLMGYFGTAGGHLPFQTADGDYVPTAGLSLVSATYSAADRQENPTLANLTQAALDVLTARQGKFWLMVEAGDVDWANHDNNLDNSVGAVLSGDLAFRTITAWVEAHAAWDDTVVLVTSDHGHYLFLTDPAALCSPPGGVLGARP